MQKGIVTKSTGSWYRVRLEDGSEINCRIVGKFRLGNFKLTNPVGVGDKVKIVYESVEAEDGSKIDGLIKEILPRENYIVRQSPRQQHFLHLLAANVEQAFLFATIVEPNLKQGFIDRFLLMTTPHDIPTHILFNKCDLYGEEELAIYEELKQLYESIGYAVHIVSTLLPETIEPIKALMKGKTTFLCGQSGVGKSSLINALQPDIDLKTQEISDYSGKGQHTTTFAEMYTLDFGAYIIDSPGIKSLSFNNLSVMDVAHNFLELFEASDNCKYNNCTHRNEPKCAVKQGVAEGIISELRYMNYLQILEEIEDQNYWELHKDM